MYYIYIFLSSKYYIHFITMNQTPSFTSSLHDTHRKTFPQRSSAKRKNSFYFNREIMTIEEYNDKITFGQNDLKCLQYKLDKEFFKEELKAALYLNYQLIKLCSVQTHQLEKLKQEITLSSNKMKNSQKKEDFDYSAQTEEKENIGLNFFNSFGSSPLKSCQTYEYEQPKISNCPAIKYSCKSCAKNTEHLQQIVQAGKQQNEYLRGELMNISQKINLLSQENRKTVHQRSCQTIISQKNDHFKLKMINCSPIRNIELENIEQEISFNNDEYFNQKQTQFNHIAKEIQSLRQDLSTLLKQNQKYKRQNHYLKEQQTKIKFKYEQIFARMNQQYDEIKTQLQERLQDVQKYQKMLAQLKQISKISRNYKEQRAMLGQQIKRQKQEKMDMQFKYTELNNRFNLKDAEDKALRDNFNRMLGFLINQSNQWKDIFEQINNSQIK